MSRDQDSSDSSSMRMDSLHPKIILLNTALIILLGVTVVLGWLFHLPLLIQIHPHFVPMQFNTAIGFIALGTAILAFEKYPKLTIFLGCLVILLGEITLLEYLLNTNLYIDELFIKHYIITATSTPGRMAPNSALNFVLSGHALLFMSDLKSPRKLLLASFLGILVMGLGTVALLGYLSHIETAYGWGKFTKMAIHTSSGFILVGWTLILHVHHWCNKIYHRISPLFVPIAIALFGCTITVSFWQALYAMKLLGIGSTPRSENAHLITVGILFFGMFCSVMVAIATWFAMRFQEQVVALKISQEKVLALNQQLEELSYLDDLTKIGNRRFFDLTLEREWSRACRYNYPIALMMIDVDYFKNYNDYYGHQQGDECLKQIAHIIGSIAQRKTDLDARYGGEEFVLLLPNIATADLFYLAHKLQDKMMQAQIDHRTSKIVEVVTISIGLNIEIPTQDSSIKQFMRRADLALYQAKEKGRNRIELWDDKMS